MTSKICTDVVAPSAVTSRILPLVAPTGTWVTSRVSLTVSIDEALVPLNFNAVAPVNPEPVRMTKLPTGARGGSKRLTTGAATAAAGNSAQIHEHGRIR